MSDTTKIEWCDHSWSPWEGCSKVSPGCLNCYAEARDKRHLFGPESHWGKGAPRRLTKDWRKPVKWNREAIYRSCGFCDYDEAEGDLIQQCRLCARRRKVFPSVCDWLDDEVPVEWLARFLQLIHDTPHLVWLLLTKRPENWRRLINNVALGLPDPTRHEGYEVREMARRWVEDETSPPNVWVGTSVEDQTRSIQRVPALLRIPAGVRFLSVEPLLGPVDLTFDDISDGMIVRKMNPIDWVIVGGESGRGARPCNVDWIRSIVGQCAAYRVPCFVKQFGARPVVTVTRGQTMPDDFRALSHPKGGDPSEWPENLRVRQFPNLPNHL